MLSTRGITAPLCPRLCNARLLAVTFSGVLLLVVLLGLTGIFSGRGTGTDVKGRRLAAGGGRRRLVHVCLCSDDSDLRPVAVAIRSSFLSASSPELLRFHLITTPEFSQLFQRLLKTHLPDVPVQVHTNSELQLKLHGLAEPRRPGPPSRNIVGPFSLAPFYLPGFLGKSIGKSKRIIFLEANTAVLGDLGELRNMNLQGHVCAAATSCSSRWSDLIDFGELKRLGVHTIKPNNTCAVSHAVVVFDLPRWRKQDVNTKVEEWLSRYKRVQDHLITGSISEVPWMIAMAEGYAEMSQQWDCNGLARDIMSVEESATVRHSGFDKKALLKLGVQIDDFGNLFPFLATCSRTAKLLQFDGVMAPWSSDRFEVAAPVCELPAAGLGPMWGQAPVASTRVKVFCEWTTFMNCSALWASYIPQDVSCALKDFDKEWQEAEEMWASRKREDEWKLDQAQREQANEEAEQNYRRERALLDEFQLEEDKEDRETRRIRKKRKQKAKALEEDRQRKERERHDVAEGAEKKQQDAAGPSVGT